MNDYSVLTRPFDLETHRKNFVNYLEVCIDRNGVIHYAVPSHNYWLETELIRQTGERDAANKLVSENPLENILVEYGQSLCKATKCIAVWNDWYMGKPNKEQIATLKKLQKTHYEANGLPLYQGSLPCEILS